MAEIIIDGHLENRKDDQYKMIAINALKRMSDVLVEMENSEMQAEDMMKICVWPILEECKDRFEKINRGENVKLDGFEKII